MEIHSFFVSVRERWVNTYRALRVSDNFHKHAKLYVELAVRKWWWRSMRWAVGKIKNYHHSSETLCFKRISDTANISHVMCVRSRSFSSWLSRVDVVRFDDDFSCSCGFFVVVLFFLFFSFPYFCGSSRKIVTKLKLVLHERLHFRAPKKLTWHQNDVKDSLMCMFKYKYLSCRVCLPAGGKKLYVIE